MDNKTVHWFARLLVWPFVLWVSATSDDASEYEALSDAPWFVFGMMCLVAPVLTFLCRGSPLMEDVSVREVFLVSFPLYIFLGLWCFFSERMTNAPIPWQCNGRW